MKIEIETVSPPGEWDYDQIANAIREVLRNLQSTCKTYDGKPIRFEVKIL